MIINKHSQLALRMDSDACLNRFEALIDNFRNRKAVQGRYTGATVLTDSGSERVQIDTVAYFRSVYELLCPSPKTKYFLIRDSALNKSKNIDLADAFTGSIFKDIPNGEYTYLLGPNKMFKFRRYKDLLEGYYYEDLNKLLIPVFVTTTLSFGTVAIKRMEPQFVQMLKLLVFIELGELEIEIVEPGNSSKRDTKELNESGNTVYVVDSSWNTLIVREDPFGVKGHYRLQACGEGMRDRKLIWINSFQKHGYIRRPKARILHGAAS